MIPVPRARPWWLAVLALLASQLPVSLHAQHLRFEAGAGAALGLARVGQAMPSGWAASVGTELVLGRGFGVTLGVERAQFSGDGLAFGLPPLRQSLTAAQLGLRYRVPVAGVWRPYVLGGAGVARRGPLGTLDLAVTGMALHAGGGIEVAAAGGAIFAESRYQNLLLTGRNQEQLTVTAGFRTGRAAPAPSASRTATGTPSPFARRRFGVGAALTLHQPILLSATDQRPISYLQAQGSWRLAGGAQNALEYTVDLLPVVRVRTTPLPFDQGRPAPGDVISFDIPTEMATGVGVMPAGLRALIGITPGLRATVESSAGLLVFDRNVPLGLGRRANFTFGVGAGLEASVGPSWALAAGYRLQHYSNANSSFANAGSDFGLLQVGVRRHW